MEDRESIFHPPFSILDRRLAVFAGIQALNLEDGGSGIEDRSSILDSLSSTSLKQTR
jgi:hypothetical protein